jgi:four helix bundle protein
MAELRSFRDLNVYKSAREAAHAIFEISKTFPREERYSLTDQVRRSSRAVNAMIAEAWAKRRYEAAFVSKVNDALGEATETQSWLDHAVDSGYISVGPLTRASFLDLYQLRHEHFVGVPERLEENEVERSHHQQEHAAGDEMMGAHPFPARRERDQSENHQDNNHSIEAGPLPVAAAEV